MERRRGVPGGWPCLLAALGALLAAGRAAAPRARFSPFFFLCTHHGELEGDGEQGEVLIALHIAGNPSAYVPGQEYHGRWWRPPRSALLVPGRPRSVPRGGKWWGGKASTPDGDTRVCHAPRQPRRGLGGAPRSCGTLLTCPGLWDRRPRSSQRRSASARLPPGAARSRGNSLSPLLSRPWAGSRASRVAGSLSLSQFSGFRSTERITLSWGAAGAAAVGCHRVTAVCHRDVSPRGARPDAAAGQPVAPLQGPRTTAAGQALTGGFGDGRSCPELIKTPAFCKRLGGGEWARKNRQSCSQNSLSLLGGCPG